MYPSKKFRGYVISKTACEGGFKKKNLVRGAQKIKQMQLLFDQKHQIPSDFFVCSALKKRLVAHLSSQEHRQGTTTDITSLFFLIAKLCEKSGIRNTVPPGIAAPSTIAYPFKTFSTGYLIPGVSYFDPPFKQTIKRD